MAGEKESKRVSGKFIGGAKNGFSTGKTYKLDVQQGRYANIRVSLVGDKSGNSVLVYDSILEFFNEWDCINCA